MGNISKLLAHVSLQTSVSSDNSMAHGQGGSSAMWQARQAVLILLASYLHASPTVQRTAVLKWNVVAALFGLLWEERVQQLALDMVRSAGPLIAVGAADLSG